MGLPCLFLAYVKIVLYSTLPSHCASVIHYAPAHLLNAWITSFNQNSELLHQSTAQNAKSILLIADHAYQARDLCACKKLHSFLVAFDPVTQDLARTFIYNPLTVAALLQLLKVPAWNTFLMDPKKLAWIKEVGWPDLVSVFTLHS
jgi:hypothetical protein